jgi:hypothetical protein
LLSKQRQDARRRAIEAALVLRNLATYHSNLAYLFPMTALQRAIANVLELFGKRGPEPARAEDAVELQILMLDLLDMIAPAVILHRPPAPGEAVLLMASSNDEDVDVPDASDSSCRIYSCVALFVHSTDRAICLGAFKALATLAGNEIVSEKNEPVFTFPCGPSDPPNPVSRALELLPLEDLDLTQHLLEFLYAYTQIPSNVDSLASRPDVPVLFNVLMSKLSCQAIRDDSEVEPMSAALERAKLEVQLKANLKGDWPSQLSQPETQLIFPLPEPKRAIKW